MATRFVLRNKGREREALVFVVVLSLSTREASEALCREARVLDSELR